MFSVLSSITVACGWCAVSFLLVLFGSRVRFQRDDVMSSVPFEMRKCAVPPDHLRSEIPFSRTCNNPNLISCVCRMAFSPLETLR